MKKKALSAILAAAMVATMLTGCGSSASTSTSGAASETAQAEDSSADAAEEVAAADLSSLPDAMGAGVTITADPSLLFQHGSQ